MTKNLEIKSTFIVHDNLQSLPNNYRQLVENARNAALNAYAPYSKFKVGASVLTEDSQIILGSNQENAAYPSGLCAERVALFSASANHPEVKIIAIAIVANKNNEWKAAMPCGACRQVIREYETKQGNPIKIIMAYKDETYLISEKAEDLLPISFTKSDL